MRGSYGLTCGIVGLLALAGALGPTASGQVVEKLTDVVDVRVSWPSWTGDGTSLSIVATIDPLGTNPTHAPQVFRYTFPGGSVEQLTTFPSGVSALGIDDAGASAAIVAAIDPFGTNPDVGPELFLADADLNVVAQLTDSPADAGVSSVRVARDGSRIGFVGDVDPLGTNADRGLDVFLIDADGTDLTQVTALASDAAPRSLWVDDDGGRVAFLEGDAIFAVQADGSGLTQISPPGTTVSSVGYSSTAIVYGSNDGMLFLTDWTGAGPLPLGAGSEPSVTADGGFIFYVALEAGNYEIFSRQPQGNVKPLTQTAPPTTNYGPVVAGGGARLSFTSNFASAANADRSYETFVIDGSGANLEQVTETVYEGTPWQPDLVPDGSGLVWVQGADIERLVLDDGTPETLTAVGDANNPTTTADLATLVFVSAEDVTGQNSCDAPQLFRRDADDVIQLTPDTCDINDHPVVARDASVVVFQSTGLFDPTVSGSELFAVPVDGGPIVAVTDDGDGLRRSPRLDGTGSWVVYQSETDVDGMNPDGRAEVFRARTDGSAVERVTIETDGHGSFRPDVSADSSRIVFSSSADLLGTNADHNAEIFLYEPATATTTQLTDTTAGSSAEPQLCAGGEYVVFLSTAPFFEAAALADDDLFRLEIATGRLERVNGLSAPVNRASLRNRSNFSIDAAGRVAFAAAGETSGRNPDGSWEIWLADFDAAPQFTIARGAPTIVAWEPAPQPVRYDVVRGDVANLSRDAVEVSLGPVVCLENDSIDASTANGPDAAQPGPGQAFFFVYRGTQGALDDPGSWGTGTGGRERVPSSGACAD